MPFIEMHKTRNAPLSSLVTKPTIAIVVTNKKVNDVYIRIPRDIVHAVWADKLINGGRTVRLGIHEGTETDAGFAMLVHNPAGYTFTSAAYARKDGSPSLASFTCKVELTTFKHHVPNIVPQPPIEMEHTIDGPAILLQLPEWFVPGKRVQPRSTMVALDKSPQGRKAAALTAPAPVPMSDAEARRLVQQGRR